MEHRQPVVVGIPHHTRWPLIKEVGVGHTHSDDGDMSTHATREPVGRELEALADKHDGDSTDLLRRLDERCHMRWVGRRGHDHLALTRLCDECAHANEGGSDGHSCANRNYKQLKTKTGDFQNVALVPHLGLHLQCGVVGKQRNG